MSKIGQIVAADATEVIEARRVTKAFRNLINISEASIVRAKFLVGPQAQCASPGSAEGGSGLDGDSRFRCAHNLQSTPNIVYVMREDTAESDHPQSVINPSPSHRKNTVTHAMVVINTDYPVADDKYSYFTIGFPMSGWHEHNVTVGSSAPDIQRSFGTNPTTLAPANKWGDVRGAVFMDNGGGEVDINRWEWQVSTWPSPARTVGANNSSSSAGLPANLSVFFQQYAGIYVTVRVVSLVLDGLTIETRSFLGQSGPAPVMPGT